MSWTMRGNAIAALPKRRRWLFLILMAADVLAPPVRAEDDRFLVKLTAYDLLACPGDPVTVRAKLEHQGFGGLNPDLRGSPLRFTCTPAFARTVATGFDGRAEVTVRLAPESPRVVRVKVRYEGSRNHQSAEATARVFVWDPQRPLLVVDIDHTISDLREFDVLLTDNARIPTLPGAVEGLSKLAREYGIVYLSARDEALYNKTKAWLTVRGFPEGPLFTRDFVPWVSRESYKSQYIADLKKRFPNLRAGIGDRVGDARAYLDNGLKALIIAPDQSARLPERALVVSSWRNACHLLLTERGGRSNAGDSRQRSREDSPDLMLAPRFFGPK